MGFGDHGGTRGIPGALSGKEAWGPQVQPYLPGDKTEASMGKSLLGPPGQQQGRV